MSQVGQPAAGYSKPAKDILDVMRAPSPPVPYVSPTGDRMLMVQWERSPSIERMATPFLRLAGVRVEPHNHSRRDTAGGYGIVSRGSRYDLVQIPNGVQKTIEFPGDDVCLGEPLWNADGTLFAFRNTTAEAVEVWIGDGETGAVRRVPHARMNPMLGDTLQWMPDQRTLLVKLVPAVGSRAPPPKPPALVLGPEIQETQGEKGQSSTYEARDALNSLHDEDLFDYYATSQLAFIDVASLKIQNVGQADRYLSLDPAPDGEHLLVTMIRKPYSYVTTYTRFPRDVEVWTIQDGSKTAVQPIASLPLADRVPVHGVPLGPRGFSWRSTASATLIWSEALDGGDWKATVPARDKVMMLKAPFDAEPVEITRTEYRFHTIFWSESAEVSILAEYDRNKHWYRTYIMDVDQPEKSRRLLWDLSLHEKYGSPGNPLYRRLSNGEWVIRREGNSIFLAGNGSSPEGDRPFLDRLDLDSLKSERLFRSAKSCFEKFLAFDKADSKSFLTRRESPNEPPNVFRRTLLNNIDAPPEGEAVFASETLAITHIPDLTPIVREIKQRLVKYKRGDGLELSFMLHTPPGYREGDRIPTVLHAYPRDYADASTAGQITGSASHYVRLSDYSYLLLAGYAIIDDVAFPVVGDPKNMYDTYLEQLVANAEAAVAEAVRIGVADPGQIGVIGHSHGGLMAANLLAHTTLFQAGVATSGSYNKTLSPFGFQSERRSVWEAQSVYVETSPFFAADKIKMPLLLMHGADDANPGTPPIQSRKLYEAVRGNGGITRLVMLPYEPHWYTAQESKEHVVDEIISWFDKYVKGSKTDKKEDN
ncbi:peptidase S9, prolyl oligopeptidase [Xylariales sp. PMI_506]|nr:peptidase S9, prolyl oligopeptidase [Xylariales sp. PMI_506]